MFPRATSFWSLRQFFSRSRASVQIRDDSGYKFKVIHDESIVLAPTGDSRPDRFRQLNVKLHRLRFYCAENVGCATAFIFVRRSVDPSTT